MAYKHVKQYYKEVENLYFQMLADAKEYDEALKAGFLTQEQVDEATKLMAPIKQNYERLSYIMFLFNQPNRPQKVQKYNNSNKKISSAVATFGKEAVIQECEDTLKNFKEYIKNLEVN